jgi:hypothetical protein
LLAFIPKVNASQIVLSTIYNLVWYETQPLKQITSFLHEQQNLYGLSVSQDAALTVLVGESIVMFENNGFRKIVFPQSIENARFCQFSLDGKYMAISSTGAINVYTYYKVQDQYNF